MYSEDAVTRFLDYLIDGKGLREIAALEGMPSPSTVMRWCRDDAAFRERYAQAREIQAELMGEEILSIADNTTNDDTQTDYGPIPNHEWITRSKVRIDARKWLMAKLAPKKYGDSKAIDVTSGGQRVTGIAIVDYTDDGSEA